MLPEAQRASLTGDDITKFWPASIVKLTSLFRELTNASAYIAVRGGHERRHRYGHVHTTPGTTDRIQ